MTKFPKLIFSIRRRRRVIICSFSSLALKEGVPGAQGGRGRRTREYAQDVDERIGDV